MRLDEMRKVTERARRAEERVVQYEEEAKVQAKKGFLRRLMDVLCCVRPPQYPPLLILDTATTGSI